MLEGAVEIDYEADPVAGARACRAALAVPPDAPRAIGHRAPARAHGRTRRAPGRDLAGWCAPTPARGSRSPARSSPSGGPATAPSPSTTTGSVGPTPASSPRQGAWALVDEGSANGTRVGGADRSTPAEPRTLRPGDVVGVGPVDLQVTAAPAAAVVAAGTRALDDSDRNRISGEVLPPSRGPDPMTLLLFAVRRPGARRRHRARVRPAPAAEDAAVRPSAPAGRPAAAPAPLVAPGLGWTALAVVALLLVAGQSAATSGRARSSTEIEKVDVQRRAVADGSGTNYLLVGSDNGRGETSARASPAPGPTRS